MASSFDSVIVFPNDDSFAEWRSTNLLTGFILNTDRSFRQSASVVHKCACERISALLESTPEGRVTGGDYYKVGASTVEELQSWLRSKRTTSAARLCFYCFRSEIEFEASDGLYGFTVGALYNRRLDIHARFGGQEQGGMSTPKSSSVVILFTGESGLEHGYSDSWQEDGSFLYVGEGQLGNMELKRNNLALAEHRQRNRAVLLFQALGKGRPYRFLGRFDVRSYQTIETSDREGGNRSAIAFTLDPYGPDGTVSFSSKLEAEGDSSSSTAVRQMEVRTKQALFRKRVALVELVCRATGLSDLRFLRASHIKPWSACEGTAERADGNNGLLLAPHVDHLFDGGWISFADNGRMMISDDLPADVRAVFGIDPIPPARGKFNLRQQRYLDYHRRNVFRSKRDE